MRAPRFFFLLLVSACGGPMPEPDAGSIDSGATPDSGGSECAAEGMRCGDDRICVGGECVESNCGDMIVDDRTEECDDGNTVAFDGCEPGSCTYTCRADDECDDGDPCDGTETCPEHVCVLGTPLADGTACTTDALPDGVCRAGAAGPTCIARGCGNSIVDPLEECDDGRDGDDDDGCRDDCMFSCHEDLDCDDADACSGTETCSAAHVCETTGPLDCDDANPCTVDDCDPVTMCSHVLTDADGDMHAPSSIGPCGDDCDDTRPTVYGGAEELCDARDNNCNGSTDELQPTWYVDCDGDGYAASDVGGVRACDPPAPSVTGCGTPEAGWTARRPVGATSTDCADDLAARSPGASEAIACNAIDEDCDGTADDGVVASLIVTRTGNGSVSSDPAGISCPTDCERDYLCGASVELTAMPGPSSVLSAWGGDCSGNMPTCRLTMSADRVVSATFTTLHRLTVTRSGDGMGTVSSTPMGISCGTTCTADYSEGTMVMLTASAGGSSVFAGWSGACTGMMPTCMVTMSMARSVTATFTALHALTVTRMGTGMGSVTSMPAGIACPSTCTASYATGTMVSLSAMASAGSIFTGWGGACSGIGPCMVTMSAARTVTATFQIARTLNVITNGAGTGRVTSSPGSISCPGTCSQQFASGSTVTLTAAPDPGSGVAGWSVGGCGTSTSCNVVMSTDQTVTVTFEPTCRPAGAACTTPSQCCSGGCIGGSCAASIGHTLTVNVPFQDCGEAVRVEPGFGNCTSSASPCTYSVRDGTAVTLTIAGGCFCTWTLGPCAGSAGTTCSFTMTGPVEVAYEAMSCGICC